MAKKKKKAKPVEETDIEVNIWNMPAGFVLETQMPESMVTDLNEYLDELCILVNYWTKYKKQWSVVGY